MKRIIVEIVLIEVCLFLLLWLWNEQVAQILSTIVSGVSLIVLVVSAIVEIVEPSKVPKSFFSFMIISVIVPLLTGSGYYFLFY
jgi:hypothetical protein